MLSIGQFSKTCMVTVKALRYYDKIGLIKPAFVNPETGYREYSEEQILRMLLINKPKYYGFALSKIRDMISCQDVILSNLMKQRDTLWKSVHETMEILSELSAHVRELESTAVDRDGKFSNMSKALFQSASELRRRYAVYLAENTRHMRG